MWFLSPTINSFCRLVAKPHRTNKRTEIYINIYSSTVIQQRERESISVSGLISWPAKVSSIAISHCRRRDGCLSFFFLFLSLRTSYPLLYMCVLYTYTLCVSFAFICHDWPIDPTSLYYYTTDHLSLTLSSIRLLAIDPTLADICTVLLHRSLIVTYNVFFSVDC